MTSSAGFEYGLRNVSAQTARAAGDSPYFVHKFLPFFLHLLLSFRSSERCPQLGGCRPFPRSESSIERIRVLVAEQKCHFRDIHLRPTEVLVRQFLPRLKKQLPESCAVIDYSPLQGPIAQPELARHGRYL